MNASLRSLEELFALKADLFEKRMDFSVDRVRVVASMFTTLKKQHQRMVLERKALEQEIEQLRLDRKTLVNQLIEPKLVEPTSKHTAATQTIVKNGILNQDMDTMHKLQLLDQLSSTLLQIL
jgi:regulator of replication initiation timing